MISLKQKQDEPIKYFTFHKLEDRRSDSMFHILIAEDDKNTARLMKAVLKHAGYEVYHAVNGVAALELMDSQHIDLIVLDIMMPEMDGYSICSLIRQKSNVPIIIVSAKDTESDKIAGLTIGSDDYLTKPFSPMELIARVKSILRRIELDKSNDKNNHIFKILDILINTDTKLVEFDSINIGLSRMEFSLLYYLVANRNRAVSRIELLNKIWGYENVVETRATDDMIKRIRKKLFDAGSILKIDTVWGFGFRILDGTIL